MAPFDQFVWFESGHGAGDAIGHAVHLHLGRKLRPHNQLRRHCNVVAHSAGAVQFVVAPRIGSPRIKLGGRRGHLDPSAHLSGSPVNIRDGHAVSFRLSGSARSRLRFGELLFTAVWTTTFSGEGFMATAAEVMEGRELKGPMSQPLSGRGALITGAAGGQGRAHAVRLSAEGADVIALDIAGPLPSSVPYDSATPEDLTETAQLVIANGRRVITAAVDIRDVDALND